MAQPTILEVQVQRGGTMVTLRLVIQSELVGLPQWSIERLEADGAGGPRWVPDGDQWVADILLAALIPRLGLNTGSTMQLGRFTWNGARAVPGVTSGFVFEPAPMSFPSDPLDELLAGARAAFEALSADEQAHMRHAQRISFATGNVALSRPDLAREDIARDVAKAAGPCPCRPCVDVNPTHPYR
jgi:hypothetical protein